jgi:predicted dehydrogenase
VELSRTPPFAASPEYRPSRGVTVAIVGCGYWGSKHVRVMSGLSDVEAVVIVDPDTKTANAVRDSFPHVMTATHLGEVLDYVDAVVVATPPQNHADIAMEALRAGKHVLIEKPLASSLQEARMLTREAERRELALMVGHTFEFNPAVRELRRRMDDGELGDILYIHSARLNLGLYRSDVDVLWDLAPHDISIMNYLLRSTPEVVRAWGSANLSKDTTDLGYFQLDYGKAGVTGYGHVSWLDPRKVRQVTVVGSKKMAVYDDLAEEKLRIYDRGVDQKDEAVGDTPDHQMPISYRYGDITSPHIAFQEPLVLEDQHFIDCVRSGARPTSDGASGLAVISVLDAIDRSLSTGKAVDVANELPDLPPFPSLQPA